jgi:hypothetical protein
VIKKGRYRVGVRYQLKSEAWREKLFYARDVMAPVPDAEAMAG